jgi:hypothetical protein
MAVDPALKTSISTVTVSVTNVNEPPRFIAANREILENSGNGEVVGNPLEASDDDDQDMIKFAIVGGDGLSRFAIDEVSGQIHVDLGKNLVLDYESKSRFTLDVAVTDKIGLKTTATIHVSLVDVNEKPEIKDFVFSARENVSPGYLVGEIRGNDVDIKDTTLTYSIT